MDAKDSELPPAESAARSRAEGIFLDWLAEHGRASDASFEALCRAHPQDAEALARVRGWFRVARAALHGDEGASASAGEAVARGGMGVVLDVWDARLRRSLAMKVPRTDLSEARPRQRRRAHSRFVHEAQVLAQLDHPGVIPIHDLGTDASGRLYFTMRKVRGADLAAVIRASHAGDAEWPLARVVTVLVRVCEVMAYAHAKGVIHRDLKPENVMVGRFGEVYVMDWGLSKLAGVRGPRTSANSPTPS